MLRFLAKWFRKASSPRYGNNRTDRSLIRAVHSARNILKGTRSGLRVAHARGLAFLESQLCTTPELETSVTTGIRIVIRLPMIFSAR
jgi:hypothetical protein